jgi:hypothetical protein
VPDTGSAGIPAGLFKEPSPRILEKIEVDRVWSGHPVGFSLLTQGDRQFAAYYDAERHMTVASRKLDEKDWHRVRLPEVLNWDSHNSVTLAVDSAGCLHLSGNMHVRPLVYFRTAKALDIDSFERAPMTGARENRVTYPAFLNGPSGELIFTYRDGSSGNGDQVYNVYDTTQRTWRRLLDTSLCTGNGKMNAYLSGPARGPDGLFHLCWVWRDTPDCATNHDLSYARSRDMIHWENAAGEALELPITLESRGVVVDPVPPGGGVINGNTKLGTGRSSATTNMTPPGRRSFIMRGWKTGPGKSARPATGTTGGNSAAAAAFLLRFASRRCPPPRTVSCGSPFPTPNAAAAFGNSMRPRSSPWARCGTRTLFPGSWAAWKVNFPTCTSGGRRTSAAARKPARGFCFNGRRSAPTATAPARARCRRRRRCGY